MYASIPNTLDVTPFKQATPDSRSRRIEVTQRWHVWYVDEPRGYLGRINPTDRRGQGIRDAGRCRIRKPYALTKDDKGRLWFSETGPDKQLVAFDPKTEKFFSVNDVSGTIRHMHVPRARPKAMWFGTDANQVGRILTDRAIK